MRVSIVNAVLDSHEIVRRQILHYSRMDLPDDVEIIMVDDGSDNPLNYMADKRLKNFFIYETHDKRPWTQPTARNFGVNKARGEYLILTDIDHIILREVIELARTTDYDLIRFKRQAGVLDEYGHFSQDLNLLKAWGLRDHYIRKELRLPPHSNSFIIKKDLYLSLGGVSQRYCGTGTYPNREEVPFKRKLNPMIENGEVNYIGDDNRPTIYMMPNGKYCGTDGQDKDYNPFGFFHTLNRGGRRTLFKKFRKNE